MPVEPTAPPSLTRAYPHVDGIADWRAQQSIRLLWDRVFDLEARLQGTEGTAASLVTATNQQETAVTAAARDAKEALAKVQGTSAEITAAAAASGGLSPGEPATGPGSKGDPIIPMSADPVVAEGNIKASLYHWGRTDYGYWSGVIHAAGSAPLPWQGGDGKWYVGWDAYMEARAEPGAGPAAPHSLLPLPAVYTTPPPSGYPTGGWT